MTTLEWLHANSCAFHHSGSNEDGITMSDAQRDQTQYVGEFEGVSFSATKRLLYIPAHKFVKLDDKFMGISLQDNPVKAISERKTDRERQTADCLEAALFRLLL